jgi:hypothetical protein
MVHLTKKTGVELYVLDYSIRDPLALFISSEFYG